MNEDQTKGKMDQIKGEAKRGLGKLTGDETTEAEGNKDKAKGNLREGFGDAKEKASDKVNSLFDNQRD
ncbi:CsbD family protein [Fictibacillus sp. NRS-1165]|uniref:CsbD family protein n=1 Tax=Fictibacillus sp. NRS-1165 TaxID=3144463 RepID=UPI003D229329